MSESIEVLAEIARHLRGRTLLVGRYIGQAKFNVLGATLRVEAKPHKYRAGENVIAWEERLLNRFAKGAFGSILLHRFLYKPVREYLADPAKVLTDVERILPRGGVLVVNSYLLDDVTKMFRSAETFFTEREMQDQLEKPAFRTVSKIRVEDATPFVCEV
jgi:hypothetical protein